MSSRRGQPSSLWRSVVVQRIEASKPGGMPRKRLNADNDNHPRSVSVDWVHATRSIICCVDDKTGVWFTDMSMRAPAAASPTTTPSSSDAAAASHHYGEVYFRGLRGAAHSATAAATVQAQHSGFLLIGNDIHTAIVDNSRNNKKSGGSKSNNNNNNNNNKSAVVPVGVMATSAGTLLAFGATDMLGAATGRWTFSDDESTVVDNVTMCNNVVPHFVASSLSSSSSSSNSRPFSFCVAWSSYRNVLFVCLAHQKPNGGGIAAGSVLQIQGSSWSPFFSDITGFCSSIDVESSFDGSSQRIGWVSRQRQVHALVVQHTKPKKQSSSSSSSSGGSGVGSGGYFAVPRGIVDADFAAAVDGPIGTSPNTTSITDAAAVGQEEEPPVKIDTKQAFEAPFLFFTESIPCVRELGPFAIDLDSEQGQRLFDKKKTHQQHQHQQQQPISMSSVLGVPQTRLDHAVICTRGAAARILMRKRKSADHSSSSSSSPGASKPLQYHNHSHTPRPRDVAAVEAWFNSARNSNDNNGGAFSPNNNSHEALPDSDDEEMSSGNNNNNSNSPLTGGHDDAQDQELELVSQVEVPGGAGYIKTLSVSPSGTVIAFGFESGVIVVAFCGASSSLQQHAADETGEPGSAARPGVSFISTARGHTVPQLLFVTSVVTRTAGYAPVHMVIDERRASVLSLDCTGTVEMLLFPADLRNGNSVSSGVHRIAAAQKVGPLDAPLESALPPMRSASCVGAAAAMSSSCSVDEFKPREREEHRLTDAADVVGTLSGAALRRCAQLEELEVRALQLARRSVSSLGEQQQQQQQQVSQQELHALHQLLGRLQLGSERRNTAAATTLDRHFYEGNFQPHFNPYLSVCLQDATYSSAGRLVVDGAQLLSVVEQAKAQAFAKSAPSLAPSTVAAKFRAMKAAVARSIKKHATEQKQKQEEKAATSSTAASAAALQKKQQDEQQSPFYNLDSDPVLNRQALVPWKGSGRSKALHEQVSVDAESVHRAREELALARYLVPDTATKNYVSSFSIAP